jgi:MFS family permease
MGVFFALQARLRNPLMPLRILRLRSLTGASLARAFLVAGMFTNFFIGALYLQHVKGFSAFTTGLAFLPTTLMLAVLSAGVTARLMARFGPRNLLLVGLATIGSGLLLLAGANEQAAYFPRIFVAYLLLGLGGGMSFMPLLTISMSEVPAADAGLASGFGNVTMQVGGAIGLASLGTISTGHAKALLAQGDSIRAALAGGYQLGFLLAACSVAIALAVALIALRSSHGRQTEEELDLDEMQREAAA